MERAMAGSEFCVIWQILCGSAPKSASVRNHKES